MRTAEFLEAYPRDLKVAQIYHGATDTRIQATQLYSYGYGQILYDALQGRRDGLPARAAELTAYERSVDFRQLEIDMLNSTNDLWQYRNEVNFLGLNQHMDRMWQPLISAPWNQKGHQEAHRFTQNDLALDGLYYYSYREGYLKDYGTEVFKTNAARTVFSRLEGAMQETDGTIALLNWAQKFPNITVVAAPAQFEHSTKRANADLLVINTDDDRIVGVQIKTMADERTRKHYDEDRIVVIDSTDLNNVRAWEGKGARKVEHRPWPGIIAASRVMGIQTKNDTNLIRQGTGGVVTIIRRQMEAKAQLGKLRVDYGGVARAIGAKVLEKL